MRWPGQPLLAEYVDGARTWEPLGFTVEADELGAVAEDECPRRWYATGEYDCTLTVGVKRDPQLLSREGTLASSNRAARSIAINTSVVASYDLVLAMAHEVGHIVLDTSEHTVGGVMGGSSTVLEAVDYELACRAIGACIR
ncbi:MAG: hypothetical protein AB7T06_39755 [Kofleriaceae bacterium]